MHTVQPTMPANGELHRLMLLLGFAGISALAIAQSADRLDSQLEFDQRHAQEIFDDAGNWREPSPPAEDLWRSRPDETVHDRRFHFGSDSAYEYMQERNSDSFRAMGTSYEDYRPSPLFRYNF